MTVRSMYHIIREVDEGGVATIDIHESRSTMVWSAMWKANTLPKVNNFMWKLLSNVLAAMQNLRKRRMDVATNCPICGMEEDREHLI